MNKEEIKSLNKIYQLFHELEITSGSTLPDNEKLHLLIKLLEELSDSQNFELKKISEIQKHLKPNMPLRNFVHFLIPIERALNKVLKDEDFLVSTKDKTESTIDNMKNPVRIVLDNIRSAFNVGSIFRTADGLNVDKIYCAGYTPNPNDESLKKTALGSEVYTSYSAGKASDIIQELKKDQYYIIGIETSTKAKSIYEAFPQKPTAFVFGNERFGIETNILSLCDEVRFVPMHGIKNSLNVSVCCGIVISEWTRQWQINNNLQIDPLDKN